MTDAAALTGGFADPVFDAQAVFRAVLDALSRPGRVVAVGTRVVPPPPLSPAAGGVVAALADESTPVWLDPSLGPAVGAWVGFHTGAPRTPDPAAAAFAVVANSTAMLPFDAFALGTAEYPDRSATVILQVAGLSVEPDEMSGIPFKGRDATLSPRGRGWREAPGEGEASFAAMTGTPHPEPSLRSAPTSPARGEVVARLRLSGPGIDGTAALTVAGLPGGFVAAMERNRALFARGIDVILAAPDTIAGLPRTTRVREAG